MDFTSRKLMLQATFHMVLFVTVLSVLDARKFNLRGSSEKQQPPESQEDILLNEFSPTNSIKKPKWNSSYLGLHDGLPQWIRPLHYTLTIYLNIKNGTYKGSVDIQIECKQRTKYIILHGVGLTVTNLTVHAGNLAKAEVAKISRQYGTDYIVIEMEKELQVGIAYMFIEFQGTINGRSFGLFKSPYMKHDGSWSITVATLFQTTLARKTFPCFDQPNFKATFTVRLIHENRYDAISNMPLMVTTALQSGLVLSEFAKSVKMSTYLLCFVVGELGSIETTSANGVKIRFWAPWHRLHNLNYALNVTSHMLTYFEDLLRLKYSLPKLDSVALTRFHHGGMENWGLITYKDAYAYGMICRRPIYKLTLLLVSHEVAHQWFGNLVTVKQWEELWVQEGLAQYFAYIAAHDYEPSMNLMEEMVRKERNSAMKIDGRHWCASLSHNPNGRILYGKSAALFHMVRTFLGYNVFVQGLRTYLKKYAYSNADQDDLWEELRRASNKNIKEMMHTWTLQCGYPLLLVSRINDHQIRITQTPFQKWATFQRRRMPEGPTFNYTWQVPLFAMSQNSSELLYSTVLKEKEIILDVPNTNWFKLNKDAAGYYRVKYDNYTWEKITAHLNKNHSTFSSLDRMTLMEDAFYLVRQGEVKCTDALKVTWYLRKERDWGPVSVGAYHLARLNSRFPTTSVTKRLLTSYIERLCGPIINTLTWPQQENDSISENQAQIIDIAARHGNTKAIEKLQEYFRAWIDQGVKIPIQLRNIAYHIGVKNGDGADWRFVYQKYKREKNSDEKHYLLESLGATKSALLLRRFLDDSINKSKIETKHGEEGIISAAQGSSKGRYMTWYFIQRNWNKILDLCRNQNKLPNHLIYEVLKEFSTKYELKTVENFVNSQTDLKKGKEAILNAIKRIKNNLKWRSKHEGNIKSWLMQKDFKLNKSVD